MAADKAIVEMYFGRVSGRLNVGPSWTFSENLDVYTCRRCFALVHAEALPLHVEWHEKLRRAIEESEFIE